MASSLSDEYKVQRLNSSNYHAWAIRSRAVLVQRNIWSAVNPGYGDTMNEDQQKINEKALTLLFLIVEDSYLDDIGTCTRAKEAWEILEEIHSKFGLLHTLQLMRDLVNIKLAKDESMSNYIARIMEIHRKLIKCNHGYPDKELALILLLGLPVLRAAYSKLGAR